MTSSADAFGNSATNAARWCTLAVGDLTELPRARTEAINLVQWLARIANSYVSDGAPERRTDLEFRAVDAAFVTKRFANGIALELRLPSLELQFLDNGKPVPHNFDPEEHSPAEVEAWILVELLHRGVDRKKFSKKLPYRIPGLMTGDAEDHSPQSFHHGLTQLKVWFQDATVVLDAAARAAGADRTPIICLPQTLDLRCAPEPGAKQGELGFSPGDAQNPEPYFYAYSSATNSAVGNRKRAVLKGSTVLAQSDPAAAGMMLAKLAPG
jgi:hypothetical protein